MSKSCSLFVALSSPMSLSGSGAGNLVVLHRSCCRVREIGAVETTRDRPEVRLQLCGAREGLADATGHTRPQGLVEAFTMRGVAGVLRDGCVARGRDPSWV